MISHKHLSSYSQALHAQDSKRSCQLLSDNESTYSEDDVFIHQKVSTWLFEDGVVIRCEYEEEQGQHSDASCLPCWIEFKVQEIRDNTVTISPTLKRFTNRCQIKTWLQFNSATSA